MGVDKEFYDAFEKLRKDKENYLKKVGRQSSLSFREFSKMWAQELRGNR